VIIIYLEIYLRNNFQKDYCILKKTFELLKVFRVLLFNRNKVSKSMQEFLIIRMSHRFIPKMTFFSSQYTYRFLLNS